MSSRRSPTIAVWTVLVCIGFATVAGAAPGDLDPTFGTAGRTTTALAGASASAQAVALQSDGSIVLAGIAESSTNSSNPVLVLTRYDASGVLDATFAGAGIVTSPGRPQLVNLTIQRDDAILLAGEDFEVGLLRFLPDGAPDPSFGEGGRVPASTLAMRVGGVAVQPDDKIVVAGSRRLDLGDWEIDLLAVARLHPDGRLDDSFGVGGRVTTDVQGGLNDDSWAEAVVLQPDGKIVAVGGCGLGFAVVRYDAGGTLDATFDGDGIVATPSTGTARAAALTADGALAVVGTPYDTTGAFVVQYRADGSLDPSFAAGGRIGTALPDGTTAWSASDLVRQSDGKLVVAATSEAGKTLLRFTAEGVLDCRFGLGGAAATGFGDGGRVPDAVAVALDGAGRILAAGAVGPFATRVLALERHEGGEGAPRCGDCTLDAGESCDDGNASPADACKPDCTANVCGDGAVHAGVEACDDGARNDDPTSCCTAACTPKADDTTCDDGLFCTVDDRCYGGACDGSPRACPACEGCDPSAGCVAMPRASCRQSLAPRHSALTLRRGGSRPDRLTWRWSRGEATFTPQLGDPRTTEAYAFCLYDASAPAARLLVRATTPAGGTCGGRPCWRSPRLGLFRYRDRAGTAGGLNEISLQAGADGRARMSVHQSGTALLPELPAALPLVAQVQASNGSCWETRHGSAAALRNDATTFRAVAE